MTRIFGIRFCFLTVMLMATPSIAATSAGEGVPEQPAAPIDHKAKTELARALSDQGKLDAAEQLLQEVLPLTPDPTRVYYELGRIQEQRGDSEKAIAAYKKGIKIHEQGRRRSP
ncbi:MAG: tetratricopeptide repeat protein [Desulfuromonadaceae bacterium]